MSVERTAGDADRSENLEPSTRGAFRLPAVRRKVEGKLARARRRPIAQTPGFLHLLVDAVEQAVIATDCEGRIVHWNRFAERLYGWGAGEVGGKRIFDVMLPPSSREVGRSAMGDAPSMGRDWMLRRRDGSSILVHAVATPIVDERGKRIGIVGVSWDISEKKRIERELEAKREELHLLSGRLLATQEVERRALARELHDDFGQVLTAIRLNLEAAHRGASADRARLLADGVALVDQAVDQVRSLALDLRPAMLDDLGLAAAVRWLLKRQSGRAGFKARLTVVGLDKRLPPAVETCCFRLVQEALTNVARHAEATSVHAKASVVRGALHVVVRDDGKGFDVAAAHERAARGESLGLLSMRERVTLLGGELAITSSYDGGTTLRARIPLARRRAP